MRSFKIFNSKFKWEIMFVTDLFLNISLNTTRKKYMQESKPCNKYIPSTKQHIGTVKVWLLSEFLHPTIWHYNLPLNVNDNESDAVQKVNQYNWPLSEL